MGLNPPGFASRSWDGLDLDTRALLLGYCQIRDLEDIEQMRI